MYPIVRLYEKSVQDKNKTNEVKQEATQRRRPHVTPTVRTRICIIYGHYAVGTSRRRLLESAMAHHIIM